MTVSTVLLPAYSPALFVDRVDEVKLAKDTVRNIQSGAADRPRTIVFHGERGSGKTWLSLHLQRTILPAVPDVTSLLINFFPPPEEVAREPNEWFVEAAPASEPPDLDQLTQDIVQWVARRVEATSPPGSTLRDLTGWLVRDVEQKFKHRVLALILDSAFEGNWELLDRLETHLLAPLAALSRVMILMTGRGRAYPWRSPDLRVKVENRWLDGFELDMIKTQLEKQKPGAESQAERIRDLGGGHPLSNFVLAQTPEDPRASLETAAEALLSVVQPELRGQVREYFEALSILEGFREDEIPPMLAAYHDDPRYEQWAAQQIRDRRDTLLQTHLMRWERGSFVIDEPLRRVLASLIKQRRDGVWLRLHYRAYRLYKEWAERFHKWRNYYEDRAARHAEELRGAGRDPEEYSEEGEMAGLTWLERFTGAYATPELVGRRDLLARIESRLRDPALQPRIAFIIGPGGIGKTRLLDAALQAARKIPGLYVAGGVIDLYHVPTHTTSGLADALYGVLRSPSEPFPHYERERRALERIRLSGEVAGIAEQRARALDAFTSDLKALSARGRIVLALDTAERLVYGIGQMPAPIAQIAESWSWLVESLAEWGNVALLIAGRAEIKPLREQLPLGLVDDVIDILPEPFTETESLAYFEAVAQVTKAEDNEEVFMRVNGLPDDVRRLAHLYTCGRPILLALLVDALSVGGSERLPGILRSSARRDSDMTEAQRAEVQADLEEQLIARLREASRIGDTILALGRAPKGVDSDLLAGLLQISTAEASARLNEVRRLSFVKIRPADERIFLHDEIYALLRRQVYDTPKDAREAEKAAAAILSYYQNQLERCRQDMDTLYAPVEIEGKDRLDLARLARLHIGWQTLLTEVVYYRLRQDAVRGFQRYYRYTREAALSGDTALDVQLQAEMLAFLSERDSDEYREMIDGLERNLVLWMLAMRPVVRAFSGQQYKKVLEEAERVRQQGAQILQAAMPISAAILSTWEANALTYLGDSADFDRARDKLDRAIADMEQLLGPAESTSALSEAQQWRARAVLAFSYLVRAYLQRVRGFMQGAVEDFRRAEALWRKVNLKIELARTLNDLGFAMAEMGDWVAGRALVEDALALRRQLGPRSPVGLSLNTLALIDLREGAYTSAIQRSESALSLFRALEDRRGAGLALTVLAEARRRYSGSLPASAAEAKVNLLREARDHAREALNIFEQLGERLRYVEALIEQGCACRDWVEFRVTNPASHGDLDQLITEGEKALRHAADLAGESLLYLRVDALVNLAWLGFLAGRQNLLESAAAEAQAAIPREYRINQMTGQPDLLREQAQVLLWLQLSRLHILYGQRVFDRYTAGDRSTGADLLEAAEHYLWGLEYSALYGGDDLDMRRTEEEIYNRLKVLSVEQLRIMADDVRRAEAESHLGESQMSLFLRQRDLLYER